MSDEVILKGTREHTQAKRIEEIDGVGHRYRVLPTVDAKIYDITHVNFQRGPVKENGVNGCFDQDLLVIVLDRLEAFQAGEYRNRENALAITKIEEALHWLRHRTEDRRARGVLGTSAK